MKTEAKASVCWTGTGRCTRSVRRPQGNRQCSRLCVPGDLYCYFHGGVVQFRSDLSLGFFGPGSFSALQELTGYSHNHIARAYKGFLRSPGYDFVQSLARSIGCKPEELVSFIQNQTKKRVARRFNIPVEKVNEILQFKDKLSTRATAAKCDVSRMTVTNVWNSAA